MFYYNLRFTIHRLPFTIASLKCQFVRRIMNSINNYSREKKYYHDNPLYVSVLQQENFTVREINGREIWEPLDHQCRFERDERSSLRTICQIEMESCARFLPLQLKVAIYRLRADFQCNLAGAAEDTFAVRESRATFMSDCYWCLRGCSHETGHS